jgi:hypothetical protein
MSAHPAEDGTTRNAHISKIVYESSVYEDQIKIRTQGSARNCTTRLVRPYWMYPDEP